MAARRRAGISQKTEDRPAKPAGQSRRLSRRCLSARSTSAAGADEPGYEPTVRAVNSLLRRKSIFADSGDDRRVTGDSLLPSPCPAVLRRRGQAHPVMGAIPMGSRAAGVP